MIILLNGVLGWQERVRFGVCSCGESLHRVACTAARDSGVHRSGFATGDSDRAFEL